MTWIWFGLDGTGIEIAPQFHSALGPIVIIMYSCLANTLVVSVVVAILSHTCALTESLPTLTSQSPSCPTTRRPSRSTDGP